MQSQLQLNCTGKALARPHICRPSYTQRLVRVQSQSGRTEPFNEGAVQVKRLVDRDRQVMLGNKVDILDKLETEFGEFTEDSAPQEPASTTTAAAAAPAASTASPTSSTRGTTSSSSSATPASPFAASPAAAAAKPAAPAAVQTRFMGSAGPASPFGAASSPSRPKSFMEPKGLTPDMSPDPIVKMAPTPGNLLSKITLTQVVLFCTFSSMIGLMLVTFSVVISSGAVRLAGIE